MEPLQVTPDQENKSPNAGEVPLDLENTSPNAGEVLLDLENTSPSAGEALLDLENISPSTGEVLPTFPSNEHVQAEDMQSQELTVTPNFENTSPNIEEFVPTVATNEHVQTVQDMQFQQFEVTPDLENATPNNEEQDIQLQDIQLQQSEVTPGRPTQLKMIANKIHRQFVDLFTSTFSRKSNHLENATPNDEEDVQPEENSAEYDDEIQQKIPFRIPRVSYLIPLYLIILMWAILGRWGRKDRDAITRSTMAPSASLSGAWILEEDSEEDFEEDFKEDTFTEDQEEELEEEMDRVKHEKPSWPTNDKSLEDAKKVIDESLEHHAQEEAVDLETSDSSSQSDSEQDDLPDQNVTVVEINDKSLEDAKKEIEESLERHAHEEAVDLETNDGSSESDSEQDNNGSSESGSDQDALLGQELTEENIALIQTIQKNFLSNLLTATYESEECLKIGSSHFLGMAWIINEINTNSNEATLVQRFTLVMLDLALRADEADQNGGKLMDLDGLETWDALIERLLSDLPGHELPDTWSANFDQPECQWDGVQCNDDGVVTHLKWMDEGLYGPIPLDLALLTDLEVLDIAENQIPGTIPSTLYNLTNLEYIFLHANRLTGTLSEDVGQLTQLRKLFLSDNSLTGSLPSEIKLADKLEYLNLYNNHFTGTIPEQLHHLHDLHHLDLGLNRFNGEIPKEWPHGMHAIDTIRLDQNELSGSLPDNWTTLGSGRAELIMLNDNQLTGFVPGNYTYHKFLQVLEVQNNDFEAIDPEICTLIVFDETDEHGEMVALRTDCNICTCSRYCEFCTP